jgi:hypothetical protein
VKAIARLPDARSAGRAGRWIVPATPQAARAVRKLLDAHVGIGLDPASTRWLEEAPRWIVRVDLHVTAGLARLVTTTRWGDPPADLYELDRVTTASSIHTAPLSPANLRLLGNLLRTERRASDARSTMQPPGRRRRFFRACVGALRGGSVFAWNAEYSTRSIHREATDLSSAASHVSADLLDADPDGRRYARSREWAVRGSNARLPACRKSAANDRSRCWPDFCRRRGGSPPGAKLLATQKRPTKGSRRLPSSSTAPASPRLLVLVRVLGGRPSLPPARPRHRGLRRNASFFLKSTRCSRSSSAFCSARAHRAASSVEK